MDKSFGFNIVRVFIVFIVFGFQVIQFCILTANNYNSQSNFAYLLPSISVLGGYILDSFGIKDSFQTKIIEMFSIIVLSVNFGVIAIILFYLFTMSSIINDISANQEIFAIIGNIISFIPIIAIGIYMTLCILTLIYSYRGKST